MVSWPVSNRCPRLHTPVPLAMALSTIRRLPHLDKQLLTVQRNSAGVKSYDVSLDTQTADVVTEDSVGYNTVLEKIKKTGKTVNSGMADGETMSV